MRSFWCRLKICYPSNLIFSFLPVGRKEREDYVEWGEKILSGGSLKIYQEREKIYQEGIYAALHVLNKMHW